MGEDIRCPHEIGANSLSYYSNEQIIELRRFVPYIAPYVEAAVVDTFTEVVNSGIAIWQDKLAKRLIQPFTDEAILSDDAFYLTQSNPMVFFGRLHAALKGGDSAFLASAILSDPWKLMIREYGIFNMPKMMIKMLDRDFGNQPLPAVELLTYVDNSISFSSKHDVDMGRRVVNVCKGMDLGKATLNCIALNRNLIILGLLNFENNAWIPMLYPDGRFIGGADLVVIHDQILHHHGLL